MQKNTITIPSLILGMLVLSGYTAAAEGPWRLNDVLDLPTGFSISGSHRTRLETVSDSVRINNSNNDELLTFQTLLNTQYNSGGFGAQLELMDVRQALADSDSIFGTDSLNALDILQANVSYRFGASENSSVKVGRMAGDWGSRRFLARHRFGNAINAFDGVEFQQRGDNGFNFRFLASRPVRRLPAARTDLLDNKRQSDKSSSAQKFYAAYLTLPEMIENFSADLFAFSLRESDAPGIATRNRDIDTYGLRLQRPPALNEFHFESETAIQTGTRRATTSATDLIDLDHDALFQYLMVGYSFDGPSQLRVLFEYDYASGDKDPLDRGSEDFDSLFGVTTFEFGPTGIYGAFDRSNISTPGIRVTADPSSTVDLMFSYRHFWMVEAKDNWGRTGRRDVTGNTDTYLGQHFEARLRWDAIPGNVRIETGGVWLHAVNLADKNSLFTYLAATFTF